MGAFVIVFAGVFDPSTLEALACREADLMQTHIVIGSDCKVVVSNISEGNGGMYCHIILEIQLTSLDFQRCSFLFEGRASDIKAHSLAKYTLSLSVARHVWLL